MTFYVADKLAKELFPEHSSVLIKIPKHCTKIAGTSAGLVKFDELTLKQLYYALLLPSGNDAALAIADYFGSLKVVHDTIPPKSQ